MFDAFWPVFNLIYYQALYPQFPSICVCLVYICPSPLFLASVSRISCCRIGCCPSDQSGSPFLSGCFMFINIYCLCFNVTNIIFIDMTVMPHNFMFYLLCTFCCIYCFPSFHDLFSLLHFIGVFLYLGKFPFLFYWLLITITLYNVLST